MTTTETIQATARPHSHGPAPETQGHSSRADRPTSFDIADIATPTGGEEDWRFTPLDRIDVLFDPANYAPDDAPIEIDAPAEVLVETAERGEDIDANDPVLAPGDRTSVVAWDRFATTTTITIPKGFHVVQPVLLNVRDVEGVRAQRIKVVAEEQSHAIVVLDHKGSGKLNQTIEIDAHDAADLTFASLQEWDDTATHASNHRVRLGKDSVVRHIVVTLGGNLVRITADTEFAGTGGQLTMLGLYFVDAGQHLEHRPFVDHSAPNCYSRVTYKGALQGEGAHSVWIGDCLIRETADETDTYELNRNLVLTEGAKADSVPNLEIENGEIKGAGHASATGRFDDEQLFYLMSRGVSAEDARRLVVRGFFAELIQQIGVPAIQDHLMTAIEAELNQGGIDRAFETGE